MEKAEEDQQSPLLPSTMEPSESIKRTGNFKSAFYFQFLVSVLALPSRDISFHSLIVSVSLVS